MKSLCCREWLWQGCGGCNQRIISHSRATIRVQNSWPFYSAVLTNLPVPAEVCSIHTNRHCLWEDDSLPCFHNTLCISCKPLYWLLDDQKPYFFQEDKLEMLCVISVNLASSVEILLSCFENKTAFFVAFLQESGKELDVRKTNNKRCKVFKCIWMFFLICMWLYYFCKCLF